MRIYNSLSKSVEEFRPEEEGKAYLYVCGLTPYDHAHLGHARTYISMDLLKRFLLHKKYEVLHIQNITDVEDKVLKRSAESGTPPLELSEKFHAEALEEFDRLNILRADHYPAVSAHIPAIVEMIGRIVALGHAYETETGVYFSVSSMKDYGKLSRQRMDEIRRGARVEVDETKHDAADFALWKKCGGELTFESPWGRGRPGWHIECSAMSMKYTNGRTLDIHGGGRDLIFPHHENEIAQAEAALGHPFAKYWMHTGFLTVGGEKMSKSLGNFIVLKELLERHPPYALRMFFLQSHYRSPVDYCEDSVCSAQKSAERIFNFQRKAAELPKEGGEENRELRRRMAEERDSFYAALDNDLDTPGALAHLSALISLCFAQMQEAGADYPAIADAVEEVSGMMWVLGLAGEARKVAPQLQKEIEGLIARREEARKKKDFALSDKIRERLSELGVTLEDTDKGPRWSMK